MTLQIRLYMLDLETRTAGNAGELRAMVKDADDSFDPIFIASDGQVRAYDSLLQPSCMHGLYAKPKLTTLHKICSAGLL